MPGLRAPRMPVARLSPTMTAPSGSWSSRAARNIAACGLPTTYGSFPEAVRTAATMVPIAGAGPFGVGKVASSFVAPNRAPRRMRRARPPRTLCGTQAGGGDSFPAIIGSSTSLGPSEASSTGTTSKPPRARSRINSSIGSLLRGRAMCSMDYCAASSNRVGRLLRFGDES